MKAIKYVWDSMIWESLVIDSVKDNIIYVFTEYLDSINAQGKAHSWSFEQGRKEWVVSYLDFSTLNKEQAQEVKNDLLEMNMIVGVRPHVQEYFIEALADLEIIIQGGVPRTHRNNNGIVIDYQEFNH